jgi:hypothetical protein
VFSTLIGAVIATGAFTLLRAIGVSKTNQNIYRDLKFEEKSENRIRNKQQKS